LQKLIAEATGESSSHLANFTMESSVSTLELSSSVLQKSLGLLSTLEELHAKAAEDANGPRASSDAEEDDVVKEQVEAVDVEAVDGLHEELEVAAES
jgi:hypothetical protein